MADTVVIDNGALTDYTVAADEVQVGGTMALAQVQYVKLVDGTLNGTDGLPGTTANGLDVDVTRLPALVAGTANIGDIDVLTVPAPLNVVGGGTEAAALRVTVANDSTGSLPVEGTAAHSATIAGAPVRIGARATNVEMTAVSTGEAVDIAADITGRVIVSPFTNPENRLSGVASATGTSDTAVIAAQGAGICIYVTTISVANISANDAVIEIKSATTVIWRTIAPAKGGSNIHFPVPIKTAANAALNFASLTSGTTIYFSAAGYEGI